MMRIIVTTLDECPIRGFELYVDNLSTNGLECVKHAFDSMGIEFGTEQHHSNGTFVRSIAYQRSTKEWHWSIALEERDGSVNTSKEGIDSIDLNNRIAIAFIATEDDGRNNNTDYTGDASC
tara:strand:- start:125 stop:487 length:363 start_codon:yes stop_codon:yes gene_type:complete